MEIAEELITSDLSVQVIQNLLDGIRITTTYDRTLEREETKEVVSAISDIKMLNPNQLLGIMTKINTILHSSLYPDDDQLLELAYPLGLTHAKLITYQVRRYLPKHILNGRLETDTAKEI